MPDSVAHDSILIEKHPDGTIKSESLYKNGGKHGVCREYFPDGLESKSEEWVDGRLHGEVITWHENGRKASRRVYERGETAGIEQRWDETGYLFEEKALTEDGRLHRVWSPGSGYLIREHVAYSDGRGEIREWYSGGTRKMVRNDTMLALYNPSGCIEKRCRYLDGVLHGPYSTYSHPGILKLRGEYSHGVKSGRWTHYGHHGDSTRTADYGTDPSTITTYYPHGGLESQGRQLDEERKTDLWQYWDWHGRLWLRENWDKGDLLSADTVWRPEPSDSLVALSLIFEVEDSLKTDSPRIIRTFKIETFLGDTVEVKELADILGDKNRLFEVVRRNSDSCVTIDAFGMGKLAEESDPRRPFPDFVRSLEWVCTNEIVFTRRLLECDRHDSLFTYRLSVDPPWQFPEWPDRKKLPRITETTGQQDFALWTVPRKRISGEGQMLSEWHEVLDSSLRWVRHGEQRSYFKDGSTESISHWDRGKPGGRFARWWPDGTQREEGEYEAVATASGIIRVKHGDWNWWDSSGHVTATGTFDFGTGRTCYPDGTISAEESYKDGRKHGVWKTYYPDGTPCESESWENGRKHGEAIEWYHSGQMKKRTIYERGSWSAYESPAEQWFGNGRLAREVRPSDSGVVFRTWYSNGQVRKEEIRRTGPPASRTLREWYEDGTPKSYQGDTCRIHWHPTGFVSEEHYYLQGRTHGKSTGRYDDGALKWEKDFTEGRYAGTWSFYRHDGMLLRTINHSGSPPLETCFHPNGQKRSRGRKWGSDNKTGTWEYWDLEGNLTIIESWSHGRLQQVDTLSTSHLD
ncbi:MAG: hypothetical protein GY867_12050 [bacterium]|nr:hypothetical protein [bacterium]